MTPAELTLTRDEALLALNDHVGREVEVIVHVVTETADPMVMSAKGPLRHWREGKGSELWATYDRDDIAGLYDVGGASFDITALNVARWLIDDGDTAPFGLGFGLGGGVELTVVWGPEEASS